MEEMRRLLKKSVAALGPLRIMAGVIAAGCVPLALWSHLPAHGWGLLTGHVAPAMVVFIAWALLFDMVMARVFAAAHGPERRGGYRTVLLFDFALLVALLFAWGPFFYRVLAL